MKIGLIEKYPVHTKTAYWFMALGMCEEVDEIHVNIYMNDIYNFFPLSHSRVILRSVSEIESDTSLDFVMYGWEYIRRKGIPAAVVKSGAIFGGAKRFSFGGCGKKVIDNCDLSFKIACPKNKDIFLDGDERPKRFSSKGHNLSLEQISKLRPLMFIGAWSLNYPLLISPSSGTGKSILMSFYGSPTALSRVETVKLLKDKYGDDFVGGLTNNKLASCDELGHDITDLDVSRYILKGITRQQYLLLMRDTVINICPAGLGNSTHRFVDTLCMGGFCLTTTLEGLDYGSLSPVKGVHYDDYKDDCSDLIDKVEYYLSHRDKVDKIGKEAREFMSSTYLNPSEMARVYIINEFKKL